MSDVRPTDARVPPPNAGRASLRARSFLTRPTLADDRPQRLNDGDPTRVSARRERSDDAEYGPDLELQYELAEVLAEAQGVDDLAPSLLRRLVERLGLAAAELSIQGGACADVTPAGQWLVRGGSESARSNGSPEASREGRPGPNGHSARPATEPGSSPTELFCSSVQSSPIDREGCAVLRTYSYAPRSLDVPTQRFLRSLGRQIARFIEARTQAKRFEVMSTRQAMLASEVSRRDANERRLVAYQERLRSLTAELLLAEERARRELAIDLHDGLTQTIALLKMRVAGLEPGATSVQLAALREIGLLIDQANRAARSLSFELSPPVLHDLGLEPALDWLTENISSRYGLHVVFEHDDQPKPTDEKTRIILFRSIRELLINAAKHAKAQVVALKLERVGNELQASVDDDGVGMELGLEDVKGSGLFSIRERLRHVGGDISIVSEPGRGTCVQLRAHIDDQGQHAPSSRIEEPGPRVERGKRHESRSPGLRASQGERT